MFHACGGLFSFPVYSVQHYIAKNLLSLRHWSQAFKEIIQLHLFLHFHILPVGLYIYIPNKILLFLVLRLLELWCKQRNAALYSPTMLQILVYYYHHRALFALSALHCSLEILPNKQNRYVANASLVMLFRTVCSLSSAYCSHIRFRPWNQVSKCDRKMWQNMTIIHLCTIKPTTGIFNHDIFIWNIFLRSRQAEYENIKKHMQQLIYWHWKVSLNLLGFNDVMKGGFRPYNKLD